MFLSNSKFKVGFLLVVFGITSCLGATNEFKFNGKASAGFSKGNDFLKSYKLKPTSGQRIIFNFLFAPYVGAVLGFVSGYCVSDRWFKKDPNNKKRLLFTSLLACFGGCLAMQREFDFEKQKEVTILMQERLEALELLAKKNVEKVEPVE